MNRYDTKYKITNITSQKRWIGSDLRIGLDRIGLGNFGLDRILVIGSDRIRIEILKKNRIGSDSD